MTPKRAVRAIKNRYVLGQVRRADIPPLADRPVRRYRLVFSGRVQGVGFRLECSGMAQRLGLTGWVKNRPDGSVEAELQGSDERIAYLQAFMASLKRIRITGTERAEQAPDPAERTFRIL